MLSLLLDLETMYGVPDGLIAEEDLARRFGTEAVRAAGRAAWCEATARTAAAASPDRPPRSA